MGGTVGAKGVVFTVTRQGGSGGRGEEFLSVGFGMVVLTLACPFIITLVFFARSLETPVGKRGGGEIGSCEMVSVKSTVRLVRMCGVK